MQINLFQWLRQGVRQSVLLGVADAVDDIGSPDKNANFSKAIRDIAKRSAEEMKVASAGGTRKRLGKTLKEIESGAAQ